MTIISVVAVAAAAFPSFDADSAGSLAATAESFPSFNQNEQATASFPLSDAEADATAAAFLPWLFLLRLKRRLAQQHLARKRNNPAPSKRRLKPAILWTTAMLMEGILTVTSLANPLGLLPWIERGKKAWTILSTAATLYTVGSALHVLVGSKPSSTGAKMKATPSIYDDHPNYQSPTVQRSGASDGSTWAGPTELSDESAAGNYASYYYDYYWVDYDEETGECSSRPHSEYPWKTAGGVYSEPRWIPKSGWDWLYAHSGSAQRENPITNDDPDIWARAGFWVHYASSIKYEYPDVPLESRISNPSLWSSNIDGDLKAKAKELGYTYDVKLHADLIRACSRKN